MRNVLIVSPHFPPVNTPDLQRVRMSLPYFVENGWQPSVLCVGAGSEDAPMDPSLADTVPADLPVVRAGALPLTLTRRLGIGNIGIRAFAHLYRAGCRLLRGKGIDLVYFSTTVFPVLPLGRLWKQRLDVPYVIDMQDPWFSTYYDDKPVSERPPKYGLARRLHATLEPWTMRRVDGLIGVSQGYLDTLRDRYPWIRQEACAMIPFGASERDAEIARRRAAAGPPSSSCGSPCGVSVGRAGPDMATALRILFRAVRLGAIDEPLLSRVTLSFVGTDYAHDERARKSVEPVALQEGIAPQVAETTSRIGYLDSLAAMQRADFLLLCGSDDPQYSASKAYPYVLARRPIVAVLHEQSPLVDLIRRVGAGWVTTFAGRDDIDAPAEALARGLRGLVTRLPFVPSTDWAALAPYSARELTRQQCRLFDAVLEPHRDAIEVPCAG